MEIKITHARTIALLLQLRFDAINVFFSGIFYGGLNLLGNKNYMSRH